MEILRNFQGDFWKNLQLITETQIILQKNCRGTAKKFWKYLGRSRKYARGVSKLYPALKIRQIFFKTIFYQLVL